MVSIICNTFNPTMELLDEPLAITGRDAAPDQTVEVLSKMSHTDTTSKWCKQADTANSDRTSSKWSKILESGTPVFVPVKRYSVAQLLSLRSHASTDAQVDVQHIEGSIVSARQRAAFQSPLPIVEPLFVPLFVPCQPVKEHSEAKDSDSARSSSPTVAQISSDEEVEQEEQQSKVKKVHRSRRGGKRHPNPNKKLAQEAVNEPAELESEEWKTVETVSNKHRASKADLTAKSGEAFSSAVMRRRRLQAKERGGK